MTDELVQQRNWNVRDVCEEVALDRTTNHVLFCSDKTNPSLIITPPGRLLAEGGQGGEPAWLLLGGEECRVS